MAYDTIYGTPAAPSYGLDTPSRQPTARPDPCADPCKPRCPVCGGLECLCRPRFFPGQLLTDDALNRLIGYVVDKNKLHNRYLHGWGVACGLEVTCDACDPTQVVVRTGYALSPCGDDIIVCKDQAVNVCELINDCRPQRQTVCDPPYDRPPRDCRGGNNRWVLAICYDERPSRGVTALLGAADSRCKQPCQCGGSAGCSSCGGSGCGCGGACGCGGSNGMGPGSCAPTASTYNSKPKKKAQAECEPTLTCEGYRFIVYAEPAKVSPTPLPNPDRTSGLFEQILGWMFANRKLLGPLLERMLCCVASAQELLGSWGQAGKIDAAHALDVYSQYAESMYAFATEFTVHRCAFVGRVAELNDKYNAFRNGLAPGAVLEQNQLDFVKGQLVAYDNTLLEILSECFCAALLPPCPEPVTSNCVPLAVITLRGNDCRIVDICNWEARKLLVTWRTVGYWLSWIPWHCLRDVIAKFCCGDRRGSVVLQWLAFILGVAFFGVNCGKRPGATDTTGGDTAVGPGVNVGGNLGIGHMAGQPVGAASLTRGPALGDFAAAQGADDLLLHLLEQFDRVRSGATAAPAWFALGARLTDGSLLDQVASLGNQGSVDQMRAQIASLTEMVQKHQSQLDTLSKRG